MAGEEELVGLEADAIALHVHAFQPLTRDPGVGPPLSGIGPVLAIDVHGDRLGPTVAVDLAVPVPGCRIPLGSFGARTTGQCGEDENAAPRHPGALHGDLPFALKLTGRLKGFRRGCARW